MPERYEREISEIINKTGDDLGPSTPLRQAFADLQLRVRNKLHQGTLSFFRVVTPRGVGAVGVVLLLVAFIAKTSYLAVLAVTVLLVAYLLTLVRGPEGEQRWRGQPMNSRAQPGWLARFKQWFSKKPRP